jgi:carbonic anhydrase
MDTRPGSAQESPQFHWPERKPPTEEDWAKNRPIKHRKHTTMKTTRARSLMAAALFGALAFTAARTQAADQITPDEAIHLLREGNRRFASGAPQHPHQSTNRRAEEARTQHPFAVVVGCSDSRVAPEIIFDEGIGDLFVVRTAGHRLDDLVLASIEYAVEHLDCALVVVLGHERCGAVSAAVEWSKEGVAGHGHESSASDSHVPHLVKVLQDSVTQAKGKPGDPIENTVLENIRIVTADLPKQSGLLGRRVKAGTLKVIGLRYDLDSGAVTPVEAHPPAQPTKRRN